MKLYKIYRIDKECFLGNKLFINKQPKINQIIKYKSNRFILNNYNGRKLKSDQILYRIISIYDGVLYISPISYETLLLKYKGNAK